MTRRYTGRVWGEQYLGNTSTGEVHDLDQEDPSPSGCQIDEIIRACHDRPFRCEIQRRCLGVDGLPDRRRFAGGRDCSIAPSGRRPPSG